VSQPRDDRHDDLFGPSLDKIINLRRPLVRLAAEIDWAFPGRTLQFESDRAGAATIADTAGGRSAHPQTHVQSVRRGAVRQVGGEPVLPVVLGGNGVPARGAI
jgi:hypothetical protein